MVDIILYDTPKLWWLLKAEKSIWDLKKIVSLWNMVAHWRKNSSCKDDSSISKKKIDEVEYIDN